MSAQRGQSEREGALGSGAAAVAEGRLGPGGALKVAFARDPRFVVCVLFLAAGAGGVQWLYWSGFTFRKQRVDLKAPLSSLDTHKIAPYRLVGSDRMSREEVEALGTEEYIRWRLEDTSVKNRKNPLCWPTLFVTYYSGQPGQVPHVPEECFLGGGYRQLNSDLVTIEVPGVGEKDNGVPVTISTFQKDSVMGLAWVPTVVYLFHVNGRFAGSREPVRWALGNPFERYGYFSKVEVCFGRRGGPANPERVRRAAGRLLGKILPVLVHDHWPDWPPKTD